MPENSLHFLKAFLIMTNSSAQSTCKINRCQIRHVFYCPRPVLKFTIQVLCRPLTPPPPPPFTRLSILTFGSSISETKFGSEAAISLYNILFSAHSKDLTIPVGRYLIDYLTIVYTRYIYCIIPSLHHCQSTPGWKTCIDVL